MHKIILTLSLILTFASFGAFAHGEDKPGPNGGHIKMPSNFHTELLLQPNNELKIFLLDIQFKNPTTEQSSVNAFYKNKKRQINLKCKPVNTYYACSGLPQAFKGTVFIKANRLGAEANLNAEYKFPLTEFSKPAEVNTPASNPHHQHH